MFREVKMMRYIIPLFLISLTAYAQPVSSYKSERQIIGGDIIHVGIGLGATPELALFIARHTAIKAIVEECGGFIHKNIIPRKSHVQTYQRGYQAWAKVSIDFDDCSYGQGKKTDPRLENKKIKEGQKLYDELIRTQGMGQVVKLEEIEYRIFDWIKEKNDKFYSNVKAEQDATQEQINELRQEIETLRAEMDIKQQPIAPMKLPANDSMKQMCWAEYSQLNSLARMKASPYNMNLAHPAVRDYFNNAEMKKAICMRLN